MASSLANPEKTGETPTLPCEKATARPIGAGTGPRGGGVSTPGPLGGRDAHAPLWSGVSARYWVCLGVLLLAVVGLKSLSAWAGWVLRKEAVPLRRPLAMFDARKLGPRFELDRELTDRIPPMSEDAIDSLGTREVLQVYVTDREKAPADPTRHARVFVTYYTGQPDLVPHVPDECYLAGGYDKVSEAAIELSVPGVGAPGDRLPVRVLEFQARRHGPGAGGVDRTTVMYFFHANAEYATTRNGVRRSMARPLLRHAYYAKVEITFTDGVAARAGREASIEAAGPLLERVMPILLEDHFDLDKFSAPTGAAGLRASAAGSPRLVAAGPRTGRAIRAATVRERSIRPKGRTR